MGQSPTPATRPPSVPPRVRPTKKPIDKRVFLEESLWDDLTEMAQWHTDLFKGAGVDETVSRNDIIAEFLAWAVSQYWISIGGKPSDEKDRLAKLKREIEKLKAEQAAETAARAKAQ